MTSHGPSDALRERASGVLRSLEAEVELVPERLRDWWLRYLHEATPRYLDTVEFLSERGLGPRVVEVGSVPGHFTVLLKKLGYDVAAVDLDPDRAGALFGKHAIPVKRADVETEPLPFPEGAFDVAVFAELLEHLRVDPIHALRETHRALRPGGHILLCTPNIAPVDRLLFLFGKDYQGDPVEEFAKLESQGHMGHIRLYSAREVRRFLESVGFVDVDCAYRGEVRGGWKGRWLRLLDPRKERWRTYLFAVARKT